MTPPRPPTPPPGTCRGGSASAPAPPRPPPLPGQRLALHKGQGLTPRVPGRSAGGQDTIVVAFLLAIGTGPSEDSRRHLEPRHRPITVPGHPARPANSSLTVIATRRSASHPGKGCAEPSAMSRSHCVQHVLGRYSRRVAPPIAGTSPTRADRRHRSRAAVGPWCRSSCPRPDTGVRQPHEQTAWTPPSPTSWMVVWWSTATGPPRPRYPGRRVTCDRAAAIVLHGALTRGRRPGRRGPGGMMALAGWWWRCTTALKCG